MKKYLAFAYLVITLSTMLTAVAWLTRDGCTYTDSSSEVVHYSGLCVGDGSQFVGVIVSSVAIAVIYLFVTIFVFKLLGFKIAKK